VLLAQATLYALFHARPLQLIAIQIGCAGTLLALSELYDRRISH